MAYNNSAPGMKSKYNGYSADVKANNEFVKKQQAQVRPLGGQEPNKSALGNRFDAYMCNDGKGVKEFARKLTNGLDKKAYPVK